MTQADPHDTSVLLDAALLRRALTRVVVGDKLPFGVRISFIADRTGLNVKALSKILSGKQERVTPRTQNLVLDTLEALERGKVDVPLRSRRRKGLAAQVKRNSGECAAGHKVEGDNVYTSGGKRYCKTCHMKAHKAYRIRKARRAQQEPPDCAA